jgi:hypothetical protein
MTAVTTAVTATTMEAAAMAATTVESASGMPATMEATTTVGSAMETATVIAVAVKATRPVIVATIRTIGIASAATAEEAMTAPAVAVAPVGPGTYAEEDAVIEIARAVEAVGRAGIGSVVIVSPLADWRRTAELNANLRDTDGNADLRASRCWHKCQTG